MSSDLHRNEGPTTLNVERVRTPINCTFTEAVVSHGNRRWKSMLPGGIFCPNGSAQLAAILEI